MEIKQSAYAANALCFLKVGIWDLTMAATSDHNGGRGQRVNVNAGQ